MYGTTNIKKKVLGILRACHVSWLWNRGTAN
jgi:hypothetical protein